MADIDASAAKSCVGPFFFQAQQNPARLELFILSGLQFFALCLFAIFLLLLTLDFFYFFRFLFLFELRLSRQYYIR